MPQKQGGQKAVESLEEERPTDIDDLQEIINDKHRQIIWNTRTSGLMKMQSIEFSKSEIATIRSQLGLRNEQICGALKNASKPGKTHHIVRWKQ